MAFNDLTLLDETAPDGATQPVSILDDIARETRSYIKGWAAVEHGLKGRHKFPHGTTAQRPVNDLEVGSIYLNEDTGSVEFWSGTQWLQGPSAYAAYIIDSGVVIVNTVDPAYTTICDVTFANVPARFIVDIRAAVVGGSISATFTDGRIRMKAGPPAGPFTVIEPGFTLGVFQSVANAPSIQAHHCFLNGGLQAWPGGNLRVIIEAAKLDGAKENVQFGLNNDPLYGRRVGVLAPH